MTAWHLRDFEPEDLEAAVLLDQRSSTTSESPVFAMADVVAALNGRHPAVVAVVGGGLVGSAVSRVEVDRAWVVRLALDPQWRDQGLGSALLSALEHRLTMLGVRKVRALLPANETGSQAFVNSGFVRRDGLTLFEKTETVTAQTATLLQDLGGSIPAAGLWDAVAGMQAEKALIERRIVLPLSQPEQAHGHGVQPPRAVMLFGPPGTGKTTFAKAVASRLAWPFVELFPSRLATTDGGLPAGIRLAFDQLSRLERVVVFIDEIEEIAAAREGGSSSSIGVVNELLKSLVAFREEPGRLLICATNSVRSLDSAFMRHGRFDFVLPVGPPDEEARMAMWAHHLRSAQSFDVDIRALSLASDGLTPADIAHAARTVAQEVFECSIDSGQRCRGATDDYLRVIKATRPTVTEQMRTEFLEDITTASRL